MERATCRPVSLSRVAQPTLGARRKGELGKKRRACASQAPLPVSGWCFPLANLRQLLGAEIPWMWSTQTVQGTRQGGEGQEQVSRVARPPPGATVQVEAVPDARLHNRLRKESVALRGTLKTPSVLDG